MCRRRIPVLVLAASLLGACGLEWGLALDDGFSRCHDGIRSLPILRLTTEPGGSANPVTVWTGSEFGIAWQDDRYSRYQIVYSRVGTDGAEIGDDLIVSFSEGDSINPSLASTGSALGVAWESDESGSNSVMFKSISCAGDTIVSETTLRPAGASTAQIDLTWTGSEYGAAWQEGESGSTILRFTTISADGEVSSDIVDVTDDSFASANPNLVWASGVYGLVWQDDRNGNWEIYFIVLSLSGETIGEEVRISNSGGSSEHPVVDWMDLGSVGSVFAIAWQDEKDSDLEILMSSVQIGGDWVVDEKRLTFAEGESIDPVIVQTGSLFGVAWSDGRDGRSEVYFARVSPELEKLDDDTKLTDLPGPSSRPALTWTGDSYGLAWQSEVDGDPEIYFMAFKVCR